mmetsp:Transcript_11969/g.19481  ORF Transcript_11969/g.19481 Transcript_11969/m.19481 type:complete len:81 (-) Transcript_11969:179-421(-)
MGLGVVAGHSAQALNSVSSKKEVVCAEDSCVIEWMNEEEWEVLYGSVPAPRQQGPTMQYVLRSWDFAAEMVVEWHQSQAT